MVKQPYKADGEPPEELSYEPFDDAAWDPDADIAAIDLEALDDEIPEESDSEAEPTNSVAVSLIDTIAHLDEEPASSTPADPAAIAPDETPAADTGPVSGSAPSEIVSSADEVSPAPAAEVHVITTDNVPADEAPAAPVSSPPERAIEPAEPDAPPEPERAPEVYCALLPLPSDLHDQVIKLRKLGKITTMPPPSIALTVPFHTRERPAVEATLAKWVRAYLPFQLEITSVLAKVIGAQQYIAAWTLEPEEELLDAQHELRQALADLILPVPGAAGTFNAWLPVGDHVAGARYPLVIGQMQRDFEPFVWHANDLHLVRQGEPWETVITFD